MASGSVIGTIVSVPLSLLLASALVPLADVIEQYSSQIFFLGAVFLALMAKNRWFALLSIVPFAFIIQGLRHLYWEVGVVPRDTTVFTSFFLGITIGPVILKLFELTNGKVRRSLPRYGIKEIKMAKTKPEKGFPNPFRILDKRETISSAVSSVFGVLTFFMSPVGMTIFLGETIASRIKDPVKRAARAISSMDGLTNAAYLSGTLVPLIAIGYPLSPTALGPGHALFNAPPVLRMSIICTIYCR